ncbi:hypothetical protein QBC44DRAFT_390542 [Cladorrhinum sp. PSN332]|nr:hypothetical protein QBC44DRAFT_390542 [Cladorrhinum sp. PSN332]
MKPTILLPLLAGLPSTLANFHVGFSGRYGNAICPSPGFGCGCISSGIGRARVDPQNENLWRENVGWFSTPGVCGSPKLDFWRRSDGHYDMYVSNGNGQKRGECWRADTTQSCLGDRVEWFSWYWCYTDICGQ